MDFNQSIILTWNSVTVFLPFFSGEEFYPTSNSLLHGTHVPCKEGVDKMVQDLEKQ